MPTAGDDGGAERLAAHAAGNKRAWQATLDDVDELAAGRATDGWEVVTVVAGQTAPRPRETGGTDRYGLVHVVSKSDADPFATAYERGEYPRYDVYRATTDTRLFLVTECLDPGSRTAILVAGSVRRDDARALARTAARTGRMYTHVRTLDGTHLGSFEHATPEKFFPVTDRGSQSSGEDCR
ncbi:hypothetical protein DU500_07025 [Haloplanus rubicundus]|uniref:Uncharacterized protein n=1 Tax=Haloplanus rubicundus TaxID=1547898 RepID=A0A345E1Z2_9EURY|nr:hypothetical protein [Haloplanus rubicundus]AXG06214.1 hypothetical protein DU500_07025 [Haloplanus rubicundus]